MQLRVWVVGKLKDGGLERLCDEYIRRSQKLLPIDVSVCRDARAQRGKMDACKGPRVLLDERGDELDTATFARWIDELRSQGVRELSFFIGDAHGFDQEARDRADRVLALSKLTLPHRLAHVVLVEQLYRVGTILAGHPYHH